MTRMGLGLLTVALCAVCVIAIPSAERASAFPEPEIVESAWKLDFDFDTPRVIALQDKRGKTQWYRYMTYKVVNETGDDRLFIPEIVIAMDDGRVLTSGQNVPAAVFKAIKKEVGNPLLESPIDIVGKILQGEDYAKEGVALWPVATTDVDHFEVFVSGLSGETKTIKNPRTGEPVMTRRALMLSFKAPGTFPNPQVEPVSLLTKRDVMR